MFKELKPTLSVNVKKRYLNLNILYSKKNKVNYKA